MESGPLKAPRRVRRQVLLDGAVIGMLGIQVGYFSLLTVATPLVDALLGVKLLTYAGFVALLTSAALLLPVAAVALWCGLDWPAGWRSLTRLAGVLLGGLLWLVAAATFLGHFDSHSTY